MQLETWKITGGGFHFGLHGLGQEQTDFIFHSDSLFSALVSQLVALEGSLAADEFLEPFRAGNPPFLLTSTYPFAGEVAFFPTPQLRQVETPTGHPTLRPKERKRIAFVSTEVFRRLANGESLADLYISGRLLQKKSLLLSAAEAAALPESMAKGESQVWEIEKRPRVVLGRHTQNSQIYFTGQVAYTPGCGLWFGVHWLMDDPQARFTLRNLLEHLAVSGLGGERSAGLGACQIQPWGTIELPDAAGKYWTNLSRYHPRPEEIGCLTAPNASYRLEPVGGWLQSAASSGQRRKAVTMVVEGSVLGPLAVETPGALPDARPGYEKDPDPLKHQVIRLGQTVAVGLDVEGVPE
jgi:CRISPR-associated protein Csm4